MEKNKFCVYTVVFGSYDRINEISMKIPGIDYLCFTDKKYKGIVPSCWKHVKIKGGNLSPKDKNRFYKINVTKILKKYESSLYVDGNIEISNLPDNILSLFNQDIEIAMYDHPTRNNIYDEANTCSKLGMDLHWKLKNQVEKYNKDGFISNELYEANVIYRKHTKRIERAMSLWWEEYSSGVKRDQISFCYSMYKSKINVYSLGESDVRNQQNYFKIHHHDYPFKSKVLKRVYKYINALAAIYLGEIEH